MVAGPRRELDVAQFLQLAPHSRLIERDRKFVMEPLNQVNQAPANDAVDRRDRSMLDNLHQCLALGIVEDRSLSRSLAVQQTIGAASIEPDHPVANDLQAHTTGPCCFAPAATVINLSQGQQSASLVRDLGRARQSPQACRVKILPQANRRSHHRILQANSDQGSQFTSTDFIKVLAAREIRISMDGKGAWRDNVFVERLWRTIKYEEVYLRAYASVSEARAGIGRYIGFYNSRRPHSSLDGKNPDQAYFNSLVPEVAAA
jgi:hypothetical protein